MPRRPKLAAALVAVALVATACDLFGDDQEDVAPTTTTSTTTTTVDDDLTPGEVAERADETCADVVEVVASIERLVSEVDDAEDTATAAAAVLDEIEPVVRALDELRAFDGDPGTDPALDDAPEPDEGDGTVGTDPTGQFSPVVDALDRALDAAEEGIGHLIAGDPDEAQAALDTAGGHLSEARDAAVRVDLSRCISASDEAPPGADGSSPPETGAPEPG